MTETITLTVEEYKKLKLDAYRAGGLAAADCAISDALMHTHDAEGQCLCGNCSARRAILTHFNNSKLEIPI